jgi:hypothetical protein
MAINGTFQQSLLSNGLVDSDKNINLKKKKKNLISYVKTSSCSGGHLGFLAYKMKLTS